MQRKIVRILLLYRIKHLTIMLTVSTHSRPKAAAFNVLSGCFSNRRFNTQPPEGGCFIWSKNGKHWASFNTQPPEGGCSNQLAIEFAFQCFNTQPPEGGCLTLTFQAVVYYAFQHTATRRWLRAIHLITDSGNGFNTQPPEGGCKSASTLAFAIVGFNTQPPEGGCVQALTGLSKANPVSTHSHPKVAAH